MGQPDSARRQVGGLELSTKAMAAFQAPFEPSPSRASLNCPSKSRMICRASQASVIASARASAIISFTASAPASSTHVSNRGAAPRRPFYPAQRHT